MSNKLDALVVVDLEATCWQGAPPDGEQQEIIEIGVCLLELRTLERKDRASFLVQPTRSRISRFCTELTTLTAEDVARGHDFATACRLFGKRFHTKQRAWVSWGDFDRKLFERQCAATSVAYPFGPTHLNAKTLFAAAHGLREELGMVDAAGRLGLTLEGTHHRGVDDAWNIAAILARLLTAVRERPLPPAAAAP